MVSQCPLLALAAHPRGLAGRSTRWPAGRLCRPAPWKKQIAQGLGLQTMSRTGVTGRCQEGNSPACSKGGRSGELERGPQLRPVSAAQLQDGASMQGGLLPGSELGHPSLARRTAWWTGTEMPSACLLCLPGAAVLSAMCVKRPGRVAGAEMPPSWALPLGACCPSKAWLPHGEWDRAWGHLPYCTFLDHHDALALHTHVASRGCPHTRQLVRGWPDPQRSLRPPEAFCTFSPASQPRGAVGSHPCWRAESPWDRAVMASSAFTDQDKVNLRYLLLGLTGRGSSSWKGLDLIISTSLASKLSPKPGSSEPMPSVTSNKVGWSLQFLMGSTILHGVRELSYCCYVMSAASGMEKRARTERGSGEAAARAEGRRRWSGHDTQPECAVVSRQEWDA